jgi:phage-related protein
MNDTIKDFLVSLGFQIDTAGLKKFTDSIASASLRTAALGAATTAAAAAIVAGVSKVASEFNQLDLLAQKYNTTASALDDFIDSAEMVGIGGETAENALASMNKVVGEAALGIGRGKIVLEKLGIAAKDAAGKVRPTTEVLADLQEKLAGMDRGQAMAIMEKLGLDPQLLRMFNGELGDLKKIQDEMSKNDKSVGLDFDKAVQESKVFQDSMISMKTEARLLFHWFATLWESLAVKLMPKVRAGLDRVGKVFEELRHKLQDNGKKIVEAISPILNFVMRIGEAFVTFVARTIGVIGNLVGRIVGAFMSMNDASNGWIGYLAIALAAWKAFNLGFLLTPVGAILGLSVAILALYDDFMTWKEGGDSLIDWTAWADGADLIISAFTGIIDVFDGITEAISGVVSIIRSLFAMDIQGFGDGIIQLGTGAVMALQSIGYAVIDLISGITSLIAEVFRLFGFDVDGFANTFKSAFDSIVSVVTAVKDSIMGVIDTIVSAGGIFGDIFGSGEIKATAGSKSVKAAETVRSTVGGRGATLTPTPTQQASLNSTQSVAQTTNINVSGGANPQATATAVASAQGGVNKNMARNMKGAIR